jgi:ubiquinone/menaquinone biosynthesis C-methylase UbiE
MHLYDFLAPAYDPILEGIYRPFRTQALARLPDLSGATLLDLACGTGQNFPLLAERIGAQGTIIGVDISSGMLRRARRRVKRTGLTNVSLVEMNATQPDFSARPAVDFILCAYAFTAMRGWKSAFASSWQILKPGGGYLIHDIDGQRRNLHTWAVELATRCRFDEKVWQPLQRVARDFRMDYIEPSAHLFGGRLFVAQGTKPATTTVAPCPS